MWAHHHNSTTGVAEMESKKGGCCCRRVEEINDVVENILIFGATGMIGGAVVGAALATPWFKVFGFTRSLKGKNAQELIKKGVTMLPGDMLDENQVLEATKGIDVIVLNTFYWETLNPDDEFNQGQNVINAAVRNSVKHVIYCGTDYYPTNGPDEHCPFLEAKVRIANYLMYLGIPYTIARIGWIYENFGTVFTPHPVSEKLFAIALPMENEAINMISLWDIGRCLVSIAQQPAKHINRILHLSSCYFTVAQVAKVFNDEFEDFHFFDPKITVADYRALDFLESADLAAMFRLYQNRRQWNPEIMNRLSVKVTTFQDWIAKNKESLRIVLLEQSRLNMDALVPLPKDIWGSVKQDVDGHSCRMSAIHLSHMLKRKTMQSKEDRSEWGLFRSLTRPIAQIRDQFRSLFGGYMETEL